MLCIPVRVTHGFPSGFATSSAVLALNSRVVWKDKYYMEALALVALHSLHTCYTGTAPSSRTSLCGGAGLGCLLQDVELDTLVLGQRHQRLVAAADDKHVREPRRKGCACSRNREETSGPRSCWFPSCRGMPKGAHMLGAVSHTMHRLEAFPPSPSRTTNSSNQDHRPSAHPQSSSTATQAPDAALAGRRLK